MRSSSVRSSIAIVFLTAILLVALGLRVWGSGFGLPAYARYHPDEHALVERAASILWTGEWNLHRFNYPPFYAYVQAAGYAAYFLWGAAHGQWNEILPFTLPQYYHAGRLVTALFGTLTILVVYLAGRELGTRRTGLISAILLGGCYLHVIHSHYATFDIMLAFVAALTYLFSELIRTQRLPKWYFLAGLFAGLSGATKYNGAIALIMPLFAHILATRWSKWGWLNGKLLLAVGGFLLGFFGGNPFALASVPEFLNGLATVLSHYGTEQPGFEGTANWRWYLSVFLTSADAFWFLAGVVGLVGITWRERKKGILLLAFPIVYYIAVSGFVVRFERNMVPLLPFLALGGGWLLDRSADWLSQRLGRGTTLSHGFAALGAVLLLFPPVLASVLFDATISKPDHRELAGKWLQENVDAGSAIALEHYSIPFDSSLYRVKDVMRISDHDLAWYQSEGFDTLIISDGVWELLLKEPDAYREKVEVYNELTSNTVLLAEYIPQPPRLVVAGYPTVAIYHFAPVRIYGLTK